MNLFEAIKYVSTPLALVAFIAAVVGYVLNRKFSHHKELISQLNPEDKSDIVDRYVNPDEVFGIPEMTNKQRYELACKTIESRYKLYQQIVKPAIIAFSIFLVASLIVTVFPSSGSASFEQVVLQGTVVDRKTDKPISGAIITVEGHNFDTKSHEENGHFVGTLPKQQAGTLISLSIHHPQYKDFEKDYRVSSELMDLHELRLTPK